MKTIILTLFCFFTFAFLSETYSQYSLPIRLVSSTGTPDVGEASNIAFTRYPHSYPTDAVSGITVTEVGTAGNYVCKGFTTFEYVKLWLAGVDQTWFDSVQVGSITTYLSSNYMNKTSTQTGFSGTKTLTGQWAWTASTQTFYNPYISGSSNWISDYSLGSSSSLVWRGYADSVYGVKPWYYDGTDIRLNTGVTLYGRSNSTSPISLNTSHFTYSSDQLSLNSTVLNADSIKHKNMTVGKDTTWSVLGEDVTKWKFISLKKGFYATSGNVPDWLWYYKSFDESGSLVASDSFAVINDVVSIDLEATITLGTSNTKLDSVYLTAGYWSIDFGMVFHFSDASLGGAPTIQPDSVIMVASKTGGSILFDNVTATQQYFNGVNYGRMGTLTWHANVQVSTPIWIFLNGRRKNTETALGHTSKHHYISALKVK